jgi:hypothetical protein
MIRAPFSNWYCGGFKGGFFGIRAGQRALISSSHSTRRWGVGSLDSQNTGRGDDGKRFVVHADEMLTAFVELQRAVHEFAVSLIV